jgi:hypothetical protein
MSKVKIGECDMLNGCDCKCDEVQYHVQSEGDVVGSKYKIGDCVMFNCNYSDCDEGQCHVQLEGDVVGIVGSKLIISCLDFWEEWNKCSKVGSGVYVVEEEDLLEYEDEDED